MFYTMKLVYLFVAASLMLVGATLAVALPNSVHANPHFQWCQPFAGGQCFDNKGECKKSLEGIAGDPKCAKKFFV